MTCEGFLRKRVQLDANSQASFKKPSSACLESQFPTAAVALELLFRLRLDGCASAMWTLHRTNLSHEIPHAFQSLFIGQTIKQTSKIEIQSDRRTLQVFHSHSNMLR
jgi:hypothetical protein